MKPYIIGTLRPLSRLPGKHYTCDRCGIEREFGGGRKKPARCQDCRQIDPWPTFVRRAS